MDVDDIDRIKFRRPSSAERARHAVERRIAPGAPGLGAMANVWNFPVREDEPRRGSKAVCHVFAWRPPRTNEHMRAMVEVQYLAIVLGEMQPLVSRVQEHRTHIKRRLSDTTSC